MALSLTLPSSDLKLPNDEDGYGKEIVVSKCKVFLYLIFDVIHAVQFYEGRIVLFPD